MCWICLCCLSFAVICNQSLVLQSDAAGESTNFPDGSRKRKYFDILGSYSLLVHIISMSLDYLIWVGSLHFFLYCFVFCFLPFSQIIPTTGLWPDKQVACFKSKNQLALQMGEHTTLPFLLKKENIRHGFDFSFLLQATCTESNISKSFMDLGAFQIIQAHARQSKLYFKSHNFYI